LWRHAADGRQRRCTGAAPGCHGDRRWTGRGGGAWGQLAGLGAVGGTVNPGADVGGNPQSHPWADAVIAAGGTVDDMSINMYMINAILVLMVVRQVREHPLDLRSLAAPVLAVGCAAMLFLHLVPIGENDLVLELVCVAGGAVMGRSVAWRPGYAVVAVGGRRRNE
jgi:hypothetical protein